MAITRTQYITVAELNEILGVSTYTDDDLIKIYEASEALEYYMFNSYAIYMNYDTSNAPVDLKKSTAYQTKFMITGNDDEYGSSSEGYSLGKFSSNNSNGGTYNGEYQKIAPKARRYLIKGGLTRRIL